MGGARARDWTWGGGSGEAGGSKAEQGRGGDGQNSWGWSGKALGLVLCAFFVFGMVTGLSQAGRALAARAQVTLLSYWAEAAATFAQWRDGTTESAMLAPLPRRPAGDAVALVERHDGFYALFAEGELRGPVQASRAGDLPILSGAQAQTADARDLVRYAAMLVRSEVALSGLVSEMRVDGDGTVALFSIARTPNCAWISTARQRNSSARPRCSANGAGMSSRSR